MNVVTAEWAGDQAYWRSIIVSTWWCFISVWHVFGKKTLVAIYYNVKCDLAEFYWKKGENIC